MSKKFDPASLIIHTRSATPDTEQKSVPSVHHEMAVRGATRLANPSREFSPTFQLAQVNLSDANPRKPELVKAGVNEETIDRLVRRDNEGISYWRDRVDRNLPSQLDKDDLAVWEDLFSLAQSIAQVGLIEPIVLDMDNTIIGGERRYWALRLLGKQQALVLHKDIDQKDRALAVLFENTQRRDLSLMSLIPAYLEIIEGLYEVDQWDAATRKRVLTMPIVMNTFALSKRIGTQVLRICRAWSNNHPVKERILAGKITSLHAAYVFCDDVKSEKDHAKKRVVVSLPKLKSDTATVNLLTILSRVPAIESIVSKQLGSLVEASGKDDFLTKAEAALQEVFAALESAESLSELETTPKEAALAQVVEDASTDQASESVTQNASSKEGATEGSFNRPGHQAEYVSQDTNSAYRAI